MLIKGLFYYYYSYDITIRKTIILICDIRNVLFCFSCWSAAHVSKDINFVVHNVTTLGGICSVIRWGTIPFLFILILNSGSFAQELDRIDSPNPFVSTILQ